MNPNISKPEKSTTQTQFKREDIRCIELTYLDGTKEILDPKTGRAVQLTSAKFTPLGKTTRQLLLKKKSDNNCIEFTFRDGTR